MANFVLAQAGDWEGLYLNGVLVTQDHSLSARNILRAMTGYSIEGRLEVETRTVDDDWMETQGYLPEEISKVQWSKS